MSGDLASAGHWLPRKGPEHKCAKPTRAQFGRYDVQTGDQWQCYNCKKVYTVLGFDEGHQSDRIYPPFIRWDEGVLPVGEVSGG